MTDPPSSQTDADGTTHAAPTQRRPRHWQRASARSCRPPGTCPSGSSSRSASQSTINRVATAAQLGSVWADPSSTEYYPINGSDAKLGYGPMLGRYPGDLYSGDSASLGDHPWALCTASFAQLYHEVANAVQASGQVPLDSRSEAFFNEIGVGASTSAPAAATALRAAGDAMLQAVVYHSDHLELSEQFDGWSGYEKSVRDLTCSYAAFLSAVRARNGQGVLG